MNLCPLAAVLFPVLFATEEAGRHVTAEVTVILIDTALRGHCSAYGFYPKGTTLEILRALTGTNEKKVVFIQFSADQMKADGSVIDPWGNAYRITYIDDNHVEMRSAGPDGKFGTGDDLAVVSSQSTLPKNPWLNIDDPKPASGKPMDHRQIAERTLLELQMLDRAMDEFAMGEAKPTGAKATAADLLKYVAKGTRLHDALEDPKGPLDLLGNPFGPFVVDQITKVNPATARALSDVVKDEFWAPFIEKR